MDAISLSSGNKLAGRYRVLQKLGEGSFAETFLAEDEHLPDAFRCVIKKLKTGVEDQSKLQIAKRLFDEEARTLHQLGCHPNIPQLLAHFEEDNEFYLVEEYVPGSSLYQELATGQQWSEAYVTKLVKDILDVLRFVHQKQVIHRDIKPSNIIRREQDGQIVLIDFGAVKQVTNQALDDSSHISPHTVIVGTPGYMPGEQLRGSPRTSSDVYAVGMIGIYALTGLNPSLGQLPEDESTAEILWRDRASISPEFGSILDKMVAYDFRQRYPSATEALDALNALTLHRQEDAPTILKAATSVVSPPNGGVSGSGVGVNTRLGSAQGTQNSGIIINAGAAASSGGVGPNRNGTPSMPMGAPNSSLEPTSISASEPTSVGTYVISDAKPAQISRSPSAEPKSRRLSPQIFALGGAVVVALGAITALASPNIEPICQALNNCSADIKYGSIYKAASNKAESALAVINSAKSLKDLQSAQNQLQQSVQQLSSVPQNVSSYSDAQKLLPNYQKQLKALDERITLEQKAKQELQQADSIGSKILAQKKNPDSITALSDNKAQLQKAIQRMDKIPDKSLNASEAQSKKQAYVERVKQLDGEIAKRAAVEAEQQRQAAAAAPAYQGSGRAASTEAPSEGANSGSNSGRAEPLWGNPAPAPAAAPLWGGGGSTVSQEPPPPAAAPQQAPLWGGGGGASQQAAPPPSKSSGSSGGSAKEPLW